MSVKVGTTDIATVGKIKLGNTNITKVYQGSTQIWPIYFLFEVGNSPSASPSLTCSSVTSFQTGFYSLDSNLVVGSIIYTNTNPITLWNGFNSFWVIRIQGTSGGNAYRVNNSGVVQEIVSC